MNRIKSFVSIILVMAVTISFSIPAFATDSNLSTLSTLSISDGAGETNTIILLEDNNTRTTRLYDQDHNLILTLVYDMETNILRNPANGASIQVNIGNYNKLEPCLILPASADADKDYEYEFCSLGDYKYESDSITVGEILAMIGTTISVATISAVLISLAGGITFTTTVRSAIGILAEEILSLIRAGVSHFSVEFTIRLKCMELFDNDPFHPEGGIWFLGYYPDSSYYDAEIIM